MKILIIHNHYQQAGGENIIVDAQVELLQKYGNEIFLYQRDNKEIENYSLIKKFFFFFSTMFSFRTVRDVRNLIRKERPDIAHVHNVFPLISPSIYWVLTKEKLPFVQTVHNFRFLCPNGLFYRQGQICELCKMCHYGNAVRWKCYRNSFSLSLLYATTIWLHRKIGSFDLASLFIIVNPFTRNKILESTLTNEEKIRFIPNFFQPSEMDESAGHEAGIVYLGRLSAEKGVGDLLACLKLVQKITFTIAGTGSEESHLKEIAKLYPERVCFTGFVSGKEKSRLINQALAVVLPSKCYEQLPLVALEAMSAGKPLIVPDMAGLGSLVKKDETGLRYKPGNVADLAEKIQRLVNNPELAIRMGENAKKEYEIIYSPEVYYRKLMALNQEILCAKSN